MNKRPRIHYHSDCPFFAGCENMLANFFNDAEVHDCYELSFSFRWSQKYQQGLQDRLERPMTFETYPLLSSDNLTRFTNDWPKIAAIPIKALSIIPPVRYWIVIWNILILYLKWRRRQFDLLHVNNGGYPAALSCVSAVIAGKLAGIPRIVMVVNNIAEPRSRWYRWFDGPLDYIVARSVTLFITGSRFAGSMLRSVLKLDADRLVSLHNGIGDRAITETPDQVRSRLGISSEKLVAGVIALLVHHKGHRTLLEAMRLLTERCPPRRVPLLLIEGSGSDREALMEIVCAHHLEKHVNFIGDEVNIFNFIQALDVLVLPSLSHEDFPNVVLEAFKFGKPVIASNIAGVPEQIEDGVSGFLVKPGDAKELALKLATFVDDPGLASTMGKAAQERFQNRFTARDAVQRYLDLYSGLFSFRSRFDHDRS